MTATIPADLESTAEAHGKAVAAGDNKTVLADFLPDRIGQLIGSADVPARLKGAQVRSISEAESGSYDVIIRYTKLDDQWFELRSRWVLFTDGSWRVASVRNIPDTPPWVGVTGPSDDGLDTAHWEGLRAGKLLLQRCAQCSTWIWSPRPICPACHSFDTAFEPVEPVGTIYSWTRTWQPFTEDATGHLPYVVVLVELPAAGGRRVLGVLAHADGLTPRIGATVRGVIDQPSDDQYWPLVRWHLDPESDVEAR
ncbi:putative nucleic-acid-binding protein containing a Zn-ribbon [Mycobacterium lentiflavum]|uniref:Putative nucleic-acid-binding protein containing a Zn-ribbon n=1 Tax=Mycobacterium lentiflavum TaxID=141349 RepID=A0A0E4GZU0_MYCLN|nr:putative nucleic-acid-binding protein containing a Zn-ribbon [Mycobacterium lentiflavum]